MARKRRKPGQREEKGKTKRRIILIISNHYPKGIEEPDLRDILREKWNIGESKGIKKHLEKLENFNVLVKEEQKGLSNVWKVNPDELIFKKLCLTFLRSKQKYKFINSKYAKKMLTDNFLNSCVQNCYDNYYFPVKEALKDDKKFVELKEQFNKNIESIISIMGIKIKKESLLRSNTEITVNFAKVIRKTPLIIYYLMFPYKGVEIFGKLIKELEPAMLEMEVIKKELGAPLVEKMEEVTGKDFTEFRLLLE